MFWVISVYFNIRNTFPKSGTFLLGHPVCVCVCVCVRARAWVRACVCVYIYIHSFIHLRVCLTTSPKPLPKRALHIVRSRASSFKWEYPLLSLSHPVASYLHLLPRIPVTSIPPFIFLSLTRCRRQFLRKMWPIQFGSYSKQQISIHMFKFLNTKFYM